MRRGAPTGGWTRYPAAMQHTHSRSNVVPHPGEELANALTHGVGAAAALAGGAVLVTLVAIYGDG